jgi:hypothetical protein
LNETDEKKAMQALLLKNPLEEAANASDREIIATRKTVMTDHNKNLFIEQHNDGYAILRGGVEKPLAVELTQDAAIEKARKLEPIGIVSHMPLSMWNEFGTSKAVAAINGGGSDRRQASGTARVFSASFAPSSPAGPRRCRSRGEQSERRNLPSLHNAVGSLEPVYLEPVVDPFGRYHFRLGADAQE